jgi:F-type H+-transporting ATPase subunit epsilon
MATRAPGNILHVEVVTAEGELYSGDATMVSAPGAEGQLGILPRHAALLTFLKAGPLRIVLNDAEEPIYVTGGFLEVSNNRVTILADAAEHAENIDQARAEAARRAAQERLAQAQSDVDRTEAVAELERAISRLRAADMARRSTRRRIQERSARQEG